MRVTKIKRGWCGGKTTLHVSSPFGRRKPPTSGASSNHGGIDISVPVGTPIYAPVAGYVAKHLQKKGGKVTGGGLYVTLTKGDTVFYFMHLSQVKATGSVQEGALIGLSGGAKNDPNAGTSTGPHLHFEVRVNGKKYNPVYWISDELVGKVNQRAMSEEDVIVPTVGNDYDEEHKERVIEISDAQIETDEQTDITNDIDSEATEEDPIIEYDTEDKLASGIWQITKLLMDSDVANFRIHDSSVSMQTGPLISFFNKICQQPLVEFSGDTFGDQYYFLVRKPPFDKEGMFKTLEAQGMTKSSRTRYDIQEGDIISTNISFNTSEVYSWYQFIPVYELGTPSDLQYVVPAIMFPEYASIWGSRELVVRSQYRTYANSDVHDRVANEEASETGDIETRHAIHDLHWLVESNAYLPFTRNGSVTIIGNRSFKRGTFVRINWEDSGFSEIFYVDSVAQDYSISRNQVQRTTTLSLSRGMVDTFIFGDDTDKRKGVEQKNYFNIINFGDYEEKKGHITMDDWRKIISSWKVNISVFMFFLKRLQFIANLNSAQVTIKNK